MKLDEGTTYMKNILSVRPQMGQKIRSVAFPFILLDTQRQPIPLSRTTIYLLSPSLLYFIIECRETSGRSE